MTNMNREILETLATVCKANNITPSDTNFMALVVKVCCTKFGISPRASKEYAQTLVVAYRTDKWKTYLDEEEAVKRKQRRKAHYSYTK